MEWKALAYHGRGLAPTADVEDTTRDRRGLPGVGPAPRVAGLAGGSASGLKDGRLGRVTGTVGLRPEFRTLGRAVGRRACCACWLRGLLQLVVVVALVLLTVGSGRSLCAEGTEVRCARRRSSPEQGRPPLSAAFRAPDHTTQYILSNLGCVLVALHVESHKERPSRHAPKTTWPLLYKHYISTRALYKAH